MADKLVVLWTLCILSFKYAESLECFTCTDSRNISQCLTATQCATDEHCFTRVDGHGINALFTLGCRKIKDCSSPATDATPPAPIIGRDLHDVSNIECNQCCSQDYCNRHMCSQLTPVITTANSSCQDDADYNCAMIGAAFNLCGDILHAKTYCRKWCGLCGLVDGAWSDWTTWSSCDVTCSTGHRSRQRTCTNPKPVLGGLQCPGDPKEISTCTLQACPVHGGWTQWSVWGSCSQTCGVGLERRDRSCSMPYPGPDGFPCFGDARDDRACFMQACADGNWSMWTDWGNCSATCNGGLMARSRTCDNPTPSPFGQSCIGNNMDTAVCNNNACPGLEVYFTVNTPSTTLVDGRPVYTKVVENSGNGYNETSAQFVSPISGLYQFSTTIMSTTTTVITCNFYHNSTQIANIRTESSRYDSYQSTSASVYVHLEKGDIFELSHCSSWSSIYRATNCLFSGALITPTSL